MIYPSKKIIVGNQWVIILEAKDESYCLQRSPGPYRSKRDEV